MSVFIKNKAIDLTSISGVFRSFLLVLMTALAAYVSLGLPLFQPVLTIEVDTNQPGLTQVFYPTMNGEVFEENSSWNEVSKGENTVVFNIPGLSHKWIRWDPINNHGYFIVRDVRVSILGLTFNIPPEAISENNEIESIISYNGTSFIKTTDKAQDPSLKLNLPNQSILIVQAIIYIVFWSVFIYIFIKLKVFDFSLLPSFRLSYFVAGFTLLVLVIMSFITGVIPVGGGAGWDGAVYLTHIHTLGGGDWIVGDPYRAVRMGGFIPAILAAEFGPSNEVLILFQKLINILTISISIAYFYDFIRDYTSSARIALISTLTILFSWPVLIMPVYYPVLTDHMTLTLTCFSLWLWG